ncbi:MULTISPECIES: hypothetical protein [Streptomyces]|uniref:hypothetical protein n=1 Tax=Streptomyces TaxID=1883 RepID=UPI00240E13CB|nr:MULTISPECIES: hypothetical protein [Streptomyces]WFB88298.1 hypothetical protein MMU79_36165 [Streptomyces olivaceus]WGK50741.1 hypothetical protein M6G09_36910 [Streptomyces sp. B146]
MKEEGTGGTGGAAAAGDRGALSRLHVGGAAAPRRRQPGGGAGTELAGAPAAVLPVLRFAGRVLTTTDAPWAGGWLTAGDADWGLYVPAHRGLATGTVLAGARITIPRPS